MHGIHGLFGSMNSMLRRWMEVLSMEIGTFSWSYSTHLMSRDPPMICIISNDVLLLLALNLLPPTQPAAAIPILHQIITLTNNLLACF